MTDSADLFDLANGPMLTTVQRRALKNRKSKTGYAWTPGTGPEGETCKSCKHIEHVHYAKTYIKCGLMKSIWTHGPGTDILAGSPACKKWEKP